MTEQRLRRALPNVGDKIRLNYGPQNINTWKHFGVVRVVVDDHIVVRRWDRHRRYHRLELITPEAWEIGRENYDMTSGRRPGRATLTQQQASKQQEK